MLKLRWPTDFRGQAALVAVGLAGVLAVAAPFARRLRPSALDRFALFQFRVTTGADSGLGSLRAAILDADRAAGRARIVISVPQVTVTSSLPPLVNPSGVVLESRDGSVQINSSLVSNALIDVAAPASIVSDLRVVGGRVGVVVRAPGATLTKLTVTETDTGVFVGAGAYDVRIEQSTFIANRIGLQVSGSEGLVAVQNNRFERQRMAGVWATGQSGAEPAQVALVDNSFHDDGSGVVIVGLTAQIERNTFDGVAGDAVHASAARVVVKGNTMRSGRGFGVYMDRATVGRIEQNDIANNCAGGVMARDVANAEVEHNQVYQNGYGIVLMEGSTLTPSSVIDNLVADHLGDGLLLIGAAVVVQGNRVLRNRRTGIHLSSLLDHQGRVRAGRPLLDRNVVTGNRPDEDYDVYRPAAAKEVGTEPADCAWRHGLLGLIAAAPVEAR